MALRVVHLSFSSIGGAGVVARRLVAAQKDLGVEASLAVSTKSNLRREPLSAPRHLVPAAIDEYLVRRPDFPATVSLYRDRVQVPRPAELDGADLIHLHWVNGVIDWTNLTSWLPPVPVVWTLHDMNLLTGGCHHSLGCDRFHHSCEGCPAVRRFAAERISRHHEEKARAIESLSSVAFVSPSSWLAAQAEVSSILRGHPIRVIANPLPLQNTPSESVQTARTALGIPEDNRVFLVSATNLDDPLKNVLAALGPLSDLAASDPTVTVLLVGGGRVDTTHGGDIRTLGQLGQQDMQRALAASDYVVVTSVAENQPMLVAEAQAAGASLIAPRHTGLAEMLDSDPDSWALDDSSELADLLRSQPGPPRKSEAARTALSQAAIERHNAGAIATAYLELYRELLGT